MRERGKKCKTKQNNNNEKKFKIAKQMKKERKDVIGAVRALRGYSGGGCGVAGSHMWGL